MRACESLDGATAILWAGSQRAKENVFVSFGLYFLSKE